MERLERHVLNERQCALLARLGGDKRARLPAFDEEKTRLDRALGADERRRTYDEDTAALIAAVGLGG